MIRPPPAYGVSRRGVKYADVSEAADALFRSKERPTVEKVRAKLGTGSPNTIAPLLDAWWSRLADRLDGGPAAFHRLPEPVAHAAEALWLQALEEGRLRASQELSSKARALVQDQQHIDVRAQVLSLREQELQNAGREREKALAESREHVTLLVKELSAARATMSAQVNRITELSIEVERLRQQLTTIITHAVTEQRTMTPPKRSRPKRVKATSRTKVRPTTRKSKSARRRSLKQLKASRR